VPTYLDAQHGVSLSEAYAEAAAAAPVQRVMLATYALSHPAWDAPLYIVNDFEPFTATLETVQVVEFIPCPVEVTPPEQSDEGKAPMLSVRIDGVSGHIVRQLDLASGTLDSITLTERIYASDDPSAPAIMPPLVLVLRNVEASETTVSGQASFGDPANTGFPGKDYLSREYPGLSAR